MSNPRRLTFIFLLLIFAASLAYTQAPTVLGNTSFYKLTKPGEYSITVNIWGYVRNPGRYEVPGDCDIVQLISFAGGPANHADLTAIKLYRIRPDSGSVQKQDLTMVDLENMLQSKNRPMILQFSDTIILEPTSYPFWMDMLAVLRDITWIGYAVAVVYEIFK